jgi:hypothetical protein
VSAAAGRDGGVTFARDLVVAGFGSDFDLAELAVHDGVVG